MDDKPQVAARIDYLAAALGRCPVCGKGKLFCSWLKVAEACTVCATPFRAADTGDGPVVFVILIAGFVACAGLLTTFFLFPGWPVTAHLLIWPPFAVLFSLGLMQPLKGLMVASQLRHKVRDE
ncbi:DUF983 domain-containing protein [Asticcacaulis sp. EMRT-3]|uniref:DUF983 domain-containing protein n=1 Tax=Asticcacaulis sp. EMRT-3 TaxID=3040349 RepID=UPI0024AEA961|nr:DUF983 domain-containing protein [Asticcacaulis sp. EMRT-3]MDI7774712.1 DUF983 domain-containing protein [Asticcacaulis sp. EMRT-3]